jgi:hypothetical protein
MDSDRFDALSRVLSSRRAALTGVLGGVAALLGLPRVEEASAHNPIPACQKLADPTKRQACLRRARRHNRKQHSCKAKPLAVTCADGRCGPRRNNCRRQVSCPCASGKLCLGNRTCSRFCGLSVPCPPGCACGAPDISGSLIHCLPLTISDCPQVPQVCTSSTECPFGHYCGRTVCGPGMTEQGRCIPVCPS